MFQFAWPGVWLLLPLPVLVYFFTKSAKRQEAALKVPFFAKVSVLYQYGTQSIQQRNILRRILVASCWILLLAGAARPQWLGDPMALPTSGRDLLLAVDISGSMETPDMIVEEQQIPRISVVKYVVTDFIDRRESDRLGLILFGTQAYLQAPLTFDRPTVSTLLDEAQLGFAGEKTAIGDAIGLAIKRLQKRPDSQRVLILLTDGANTAGEVSPRQAADLAAQSGVKIYTVGVGANEMIRRMGIFGGYARVINPSSDLDEDTLKYIAETTGGQYFRAHDPEELQRIYTLMDQLEPIKQADEVIRPIKALFYWPLAIALLLSFFVAVLFLLQGASTKSVTQKATTGV